MINKTAFPANTIFRFRAYSPVSFKEIQYSEIFFVAKDELNDPYDTKNPALFVANREIYQRLVKFILTQKTFLLSTLEGIDIESIAEYLAEGDLLYDDLIVKLNSVEFEQIVLNAFAVDESIGLSLVFIKRIKHFIHKYTGGHCYIASFTKKCYDPVMWSHYAHYHTGFCLCFSIEGNTIKSNHNNKSTYFKNEYEIEEVNYRDANFTINGFYSLPGAIYGEKVSEEEVRKYWDTKRKSFLTKYVSWKYEEEIRIIQDDWLTDNATDNGVEKKPISERTFYYDPIQLTGIIFGSKMKQREKNELINLIYKVRDKRSKGGDLLPLFVFYEAIENTSQYEMNIRPISGFDTFNKMFNSKDIKIKEEEFIKMNKLITRKQNI